MSASLFLVQTLNGLQLGVLLFLIAAGLTLVFGVMDFINLAHGVQYMIGAYLAAMFVAWTGSFWAGLALTLPAALLVGLGLEALVFRRLYGREHLDQILATFGIILFLNESVKVIWGAAPLSVPTPDLLSGNVRLLGGVNYPVYRLALIGTGLCVALGLAWLVNGTRAGMLVRAGASDAPMVAALGVNIRRLFAFLAGFGAMLAGFAGALVAPIQSVEPGMGDNLLIFAFVVIVIGGVGSIRGAFFGALLVGLVDVLGRAFGVQALRLVLSGSAASQAGRSLAPMLIYVVMAVVLFWRPSGLFPRQIMSFLVSEHGRRGWGAPALIVFALLAAAPLIAHAGANSYWLSLLARGITFALAALALDYLVGQAGLVSFGHDAFLGIGAYAVAILAAAGVDEILLRLIIAMAAGLVFALATSAISLRASGVYYIMSTLAFGQMLYFFAVSLSAFGGDDGVTLDGRAKLWGSTVLNDDRAFYAFALALLILAYAGIDRLVGSRFGRVLAAARQNPLRTQAAGFDPFRYRLVACGISGALCAAAGVLLAEQTGFVSPAYQGWQRSGELLAMTILGGVGSLWGAIVGAVVYVILSDQLSTWTEHADMILGPLLICVALAGRGGLAGLLARARGGRR